MDVTAAENDRETQEACCAPSTPTDCAVGPSLAQSHEHPQTAVAEQTGLFDEDNAQEVFVAWMRSQPYYARRMLAVLLTEMFRRRYELGLVAAAQEAAVITGWSFQTVRRFRKEFFDNKGELKMGKGWSGKLKAAPKRISMKNGAITKEPSKVKGQRKPRKK